MIVSVVVKKKAVSTSTADISEKSPKNNEVKPKDPTFQELKMMSWLELSTLQLDVLAEIDRIKTQLNESKSYISKGKKHSIFNKDWSYRAKSALRKKGILMQSINLCLKLIRTNASAHRAEVFERNFIKNCRKMLPADEMEKIMAATHDDMNKELA